MQFRILGSLEIVDGGRPHRFGGRKPGALLALFLIHANEVVSVDRLLDALWVGQEPGRATKALHTTVKRVREALPDAQQLRTQTPGYVLSVAPGELDRECFERLFDQGRRALESSDEAGASAALADALSLWRGPALADFAYEPFAQAEIARLEELRLACLEARIEADLALSRHREVVSELEALVTAYPVRERLRGQLMLALYRSGRQAEALTVYQDTRRALLEELGIDPSLDLKELEQAILRQEPSLTPPTSRTHSLSEKRFLEAPVAPLPARQARKVVTILSAHLADWTVQAEALDPELVSRVQTRWLDHMRAAVDRHGGTVESFSAGRTVAVFGVPMAHEDDALRSARTAIELRSAIAALRPELEREHGFRLDIRIGIDTGEVVTGDPASGQALVAGDAVRTAGSLADAAQLGEITLTQSTYRLVRDSVRGQLLSPADHTMGAATFCLEDVTEGRPSPHLETPLIGRRQELADLHAALGRAGAERSSILVTVVGLAGIGKTRLAVEFARTVADDVTVLVGRCLSYGEGITFWPLAEALRGLDLNQALAGVADASQTERRLESLITHGEGLGTIEEGFLAVRRLFEALARERPLVLVFEDLHWAEPSLLDLIEYLASFTTSAQLLLLCLARPELLEVRPAWKGERVELAPLEPSEAGRLIELLAPEGLAVERRAEIAAVAEGNPLFLEQMLALATEGHGTGVPPTIQALLSDRLDRLEPDERSVIETAAIVGNSFHWGAVEELVPSNVHGRTGRLLLGLDRKGFVAPDRSNLPDEDAFAFRHVLIRETAYAMIPKERRAKLHEGFADWAATHFSGQEEIVGYHLEQAYGYRTELGSIDDETRTLATRASEVLAAAGTAATERGDAAAAANLLSRAAALPRENERAGLELLLDLADVLIETGELGRASSALAQAEDGARRLAERDLELHARILQQHVKVSTDPVGWVEQARHEAEQAIPALEKLGADRALSRAWRLVGLIHFVECQGASMEEALKRGLVHAERANDRRERAEILSWMGLAIWLARPVLEGIRQLEALLKQGAGNPKFEAMTLETLAKLYADRGRFREAEALSARSQRICEEFGLNVIFALYSTMRGSRYLLADNPQSAERDWRAAYEFLAPTGEKAYLSGFAGGLARALYAQKRYEEADEFAGIGRELAADEDTAIQVWWRGVHAKVLARSGNLREAESLARECVELASKSDSDEMHADALMDLGEVLQLTGRPDEAGEAIAGALGLYERKGNVVSARKAVALLAQLAPIDTPQK